MFKKRMDIIDKPVITRDTGTQLDRVREIIFDPKTNRVLGLIVDPDGWFSQAKILLWEGVGVIGPDAVIATSEDFLITADQAPPLQTAIDQGNVFKGAKVITTKGDDVGQLKDMYFDAQSGQVEGYEILSNPIANLLSDQSSFMPASMVVKMGQDTVLVKPGTIASLTADVPAVSATEDGVPAPTLAANQGVIPQ